MIPSDMAVLYVVSGFVIGLMLCGFHRIWSNTHWKLSPGATERDLLMAKVGATFGLLLVSSLLWPVLILVLIVKASRDGEP